MNIEQYRLDASRTLADLGSFEKDARHMLVGILTECGELLDVHKKTVCYGKTFDKVNYKEELGDLAWYGANLLNLLESTIEVPSMDSITRFITSDVIDHEKNIASLVYRASFALHSDAKNPMLLHLVAVEVFTVLQIEAASYNFDVQEILDTNIAKLAARYPEKFSQDRAINRDLNKERTILEGKL